MIVILKIYNDSDIKNKVILRIYLFILVLQQFINTGKN